MPMDTTSIYQTDGWSPPVDHQKAVREARAILRAAKRARKAHSHQLAQEAKRRVENARLRQVAVEALEDVASDPDQPGDARARAAKRLLATSH